MEPLAREVFAGHWTGKSRTRMHSHVLLASCEHFRARRCRCDSICDPLEFEPLIFDGWFNLKLAQVIEGFSGWFRGYSGLVQKLFEGYSIQGWCVGYFEPFSFFFFILAIFHYFSSFAFKIDLGNCQKELFLEPFSCFFVVFFVLAIFPPLPSKSLEIIKDAFSRTLFFLFRFCRLFFVFSFWLFFLLCLQTLRIDVGL